MSEVEMFDVQPITSAASSFLSRIFKLDELQDQLCDALRRRCEKSWNVNKPQAGSGNRTLVFDYGSMDEAFLEICITLGINDHVMQARRKFPHDFNLHMDPGSCSVIFNWGYLARDISEITLFPGSGLHTFQTIIKDRVRKSPKVVVQVLSTDLVGVDVGPPEGHAATAEQPQYLAYGSDSGYTASTSPLDLQSDSMSDSSRGSSPTLSDSSDFNSSPSKMNNYHATIQNSQLLQQSTLMQTPARSQGYHSMMSYKLLSSPAQYSPLATSNYNSSHYSPATTSGYGQVGYHTLNASSYQQCSSEYSCNTSYSKPAANYIENVNVMA